MILSYTVIAGKYDGGEENIKWIEDFPTLDEAFNALDNNTGYPIRKIEIRNGDFVWELDHTYGSYRP